MEISADRECGECGRPWDGPRSGLHSDIQRCDWPKTDAMCVWRYALVVAAFVGVGDAVDNGIGEPIPVPLATSDQ